MAPNPSPNRPNTSLIRRALRYAEHHPGEIADLAGEHQRGRPCRDERGMCFNALAADLATGSWADEILGITDPEWLVADHRDHPGEVVTLVHCHSRAATVLGIELHDDDKTRLADFRRLLATGREL